MLLYSGGLDTSVICRWLVERGGEVICFAADVGQREDWPALRRKAGRSGARKVIVADIRERFVSDYVFPAIRMNALYEGRYLLGTSLARPAIAEAMVQAARREGCDTFVHGATGKGNDQVRFELAAAALAPDLAVYAPWRDPAFSSEISGRREAIAYAARHDIPVKASTKKPWSSDENLMHISFEAGLLENPDARPPADMFELTADPRRAPERSQMVTVDFERGRPVAFDGQRMRPHLLLAAANRLAGRHGIGRVDMVESRYVGMKSRGVYETPGGTLLMALHRDLEGLTVDRDLMALRDSLIPRMAHLIYNGYWFSPEMDALRALVDVTQTYVTGRVKAELYKGNAIIAGRSSPHSLYDAAIASMEADGGVYDQTLATGFIRLHGLPLRAHACRRTRMAASAQTERETPEKPFMDGHI
jgi:argininosuccinate synthase